MNKLTALVLAGTRPGGDPLADYAGVSHKALIEIGGLTMIERVVAALAATPEVGRILIAIDRTDILENLPGLRAPACTKPISTMPTAAGGPSASVAAALQAEGTPLLVTTADHALLQAEWVSAFVRQGRTDVDLTVGLTTKAAVQAAAPHTQRTYLHFADGDYSACNLFLMQRPAARGVVELWQEMERLRKQPIKMILRLGAGFALRYKLGQLRLDQALERLGELTGASIAKTDVAAGRAAIDVDKAADLDLVRELVGP